MKSKQIHLKILVQQSDLVSIRINCASLLFKMNQLDVCAFQGNELKNLLNAFDAEYHRLGAVYCKTPSPRSGTKVESFYALLLAKEVFAQELSTAQAQASELVLAHKNKAADNNCQERHSYMAAWHQLSLHQDNIFQLLQLESTDYIENQLSLLLQPNDADFLDSIVRPGRNRLLANSGELGHFIIARLYAMKASAVLGERVTYGKIEEALNFIHDRKNFDNGTMLFDYSEEELKHEVTKLILHANRHPNQKIIWLGTASTVIDMRNKNPGQGAYFNFSEGKFSWELNRAYLQIAATLGYEFKLINRQFPNVEKALCSGQPAQLLIELARQIRPESRKTTTLYDGGDQPTATSLESLVLMDLGLTAKVRDDRIVFTQEKQLNPAVRSTCLMSRTMSRGRAHSMEPRISLERAPVMPVDERNKLFEIPKVVHF